MVLVVGGMIGAGKTTLSEIIAKELKTKVIYESVDDNPILPLFYTATEEEIQAKRYPFLLQLHFLNARFKNIKEALKENNNVLDRSIYEDWYFAKINKELGRITELEFSIYESLLDNMLEELKEMPKKSPDLMIYLKGSFETILSRIQKRGRSFELDDNLKSYYYTLWSKYDDWVFNHYDKSGVLIIDIDKYDYVNNADDKKYVLEQIKSKLVATNKVLLFA